MDRPKTAHDARDFGGVQLQADPHDLEPGIASDQLNIKSDQPGSMQTRPGMRSVTFDYSA